MKYIAITGLEGRDELYTLKRSKLKVFEQKFGRFDGFWNDHDQAVEWVRANGKFVDFCTCVA